MGMHYATLAIHVTPLSCQVPVETVLGTQWCHMDCQSSIVHPHHLHGSQGERSSGSIPPLRKRPCHKSVPGTPVCSQRCGSHCSLLWLWWRLHSDRQTGVPGHSYDKTTCEAVGCCRWNILLGCRADDGDA